MFILFAIISSIALLAIFISFYKIIKLNTELKIILKQYDDLNDQNKNLQNEKISHIQQMEQLSAKIEYLKEQNANFENMQQESFNSAKAALFDLGSSLSKQLIDIHKKENQDIRELSEKNITNNAKKFNAEFERLLNIIGSLNKDIKESKNTVDVIKQSLLSPTSCGNLAEITLENILKSSGLRTQLDFSIQHTINTANDSKLRPDAIIFLPGDNLMIIDAKSSKFLLDDMDPKNLAKTMNNHIKSLDSKEYAKNAVNNLQNQGKDINNVITLMFLPTEQAIEKVLEIDNNFINKAWEMNIFPVGPVGLMNMLSFSKFQISQQMQAENQKLIIEEVKKLLFSIASITEHSQKLGHNIQSIVNNYDKFAASFNRNFLSKAKNIKKLGIDTGYKEAIYNLERYQIISSKTELIDVEITPNSTKIKELT